MIEMNVGGIIVETILEKLWGKYLMDKWEAEHEDYDIKEKLMSTDSPDGKQNSKCSETHFQDMLLSM